MGGILDTLQGIADFFVAVGDFVVKLVADIVNLVENLGKSVAWFVSFLPNLDGFLPASIVAVLALLIVLLITLRVAGRD